MLHEEPTQVFFRRAGGSRGRARVHGRPEVEAGPVAKVARRSSESFAAPRASIDLEAPDGADVLEANHEAHECSSQRVLSAACRARAGFRRFYWSAACRSRRRTRWWRSKTPSSPAGRRGSRVCSIAPCPERPSRPVGTPAPTTWCATPTSASSSTRRPSSRPVCHRVPSIPQRSVSRMRLVSSADLLFEAGRRTSSPPLCTGRWSCNRARFFTAIPTSANETITRQNAFVRVDAELLPDRWRPLASAPGLPPSPSLSPGAAPVRLGLLLQSDVVVPPGQQREVRIRIDNVRLETVGEVPSPRVSLVAVPSPEGGHVVFAPPECFDGSVGPYEIYVGAEADRDLEGCVGFRAPNLTSPGRSVSSALRREIGAPAWIWRARTTLPAKSSSSRPTRARRSELPSLARVEPCLVRVAGGDLTCDELRDVCVVEVLVGLVCHLRPPGDAESVFCFSDFGSRSTVHVGARSARADSHDATDALETLRRLRDEAMATTAAGRYYRDLYEAFSPELRELPAGRPPHRARRLLQRRRRGSPLSPSWSTAAARSRSSRPPWSPTCSRSSIVSRHSASPTLRELFRSERARLRLADMAGRSIEDAFALVEERGAPAACATSDTSLCLQGGRFRVEVTWTDFEERSGSGSRRVAFRRLGVFLVLRPKRTSSWW